MERIWKWAWDRYGARYTWMLCAITIPVVLPIYLVLSFVVVAFEGSGHYAEAAGITVLAVPVMVYLMILPGWGPSRPMERWAAGHDVDRMTALEATYKWTRTTAPRAVAINAAWAA